jgi:hypothetical protein
MPTSSTCSSGVFCGGPSFTSQTCSGGTLCGLDVNTLQTCIVDCITLVPAFSSTPSF